jgi:hypothetical protein
MSNVTFLHKKLFFSIITSIFCLGVLDYQPASGQNEGSNRNNSPRGTENNQGSSNKKPPATNTDAKPPATNTDAQPPATNTDAQPPVTNTDKKPPVTNTDKKPPVTNTDTKPPVTNTDKKPPVTDDKKDPFCPSGKYETPSDTNNPLLTINIPLTKPGQWLNSAYQPQKLVQPIGLIFQKQGKLTIVYKNSASSPVYRDVNYELCQDNIEKIKKDGIKDINNFGKMGINIKLDESRSVNTIFEIKTDARAKTLSLQMELLKLKSGETRPENFTQDRSVFFKPLPYNLDFVTLQ